MKNMLTSQDILHAEFKKSMRGYDTKEVDYFLDEIVATLEHYNKKITELEEQIAKSKEQLSSFEETRELMQSTLLMAQKSAEARVERARAEAEEIIAAARAEADDIRNGAYREKSELFTELERTRQLREAYFEEAKQMLARFGDMLTECEKPSETAAEATQIMEDFAKAKAEENNSGVEFKAENLRFEYEQEQPVIPQKEIAVEENIAAEETVEETVMEDAVEEASVPETVEEEKISDEDVFALCDSEELIQKDAQAERSLTKHPDEKELEAQNLAEAEKTSFADKNQSNLFGEDEEPTKLVKHINYAEADDLDE